MRYDNIYRSVYHYNLVPKNPRVLVFGCSTGQEIKTIRTIWPLAEIIGCDIDTDALEKAKQIDPYAKFFISTDKDLKNAGNFDLVWLS